MADDKNKIREPFPPEQTPNPPQIIDPSQKKERGEPDKPIESPESERKDDRNPSQGEDRKEKKLLNEDADINDETTI